jgi:hypothetical protein
MPRSEGTTQLSTHSYLHYINNQLRKKLSEARAAGNQHDIERFERRLAQLPNLWLCLDGKGTPGTPVKLLMLKTRPEAEEYDPTQLQKWQQAKRTGGCIVKGFE